MHSVSLSEELFSNTEHVTEIFLTERSHASPSAQKPGANDPSRKSLALGPEPVNSRVGAAAAFQKPRTPSRSSPPGLQTAKTTLPSRLGHQKCKDTRLRNRPLLPGSARASGIAPHTFFQYQTHHCTESRTIAKPPPELAQGPPSARMFDSHFGQTVNEKEVDSILPIQSLSPEEAQTHPNDPRAFDVSEQGRRVTAGFCRRLPPLSTLAAASHVGPRPCIPHDLPQTERSPPHTHTRPPRLALGTKCAGEGTTQSQTGSDKLDLGPERDRKKPAQVSSLSASLQRRDGGEGTAVQQKASGPRRQDPSKRRPSWSCGELSAWPLGNHRGRISGPGSRWASRSSLS